MCEGASNSPLRDAGVTALTPFLLPLPSSSSSHPHPPSHPPPLLIPLPPPSPSSQGQVELLKHARSEVLENLKQIHYAALTCKLSKGGQTISSSGSDSKSRASLEAIPEKATAEDELSDEDN